MTEESELQAKIAALSGKIYQHKQHQHSPPVASSGYAPFPSSSPVYPSRGGHSSRWKPYGRAGYPTAFKNRTLVLGGGGQATPASPCSNNGDKGTSISTTTQQTPSKSGAESFVSTRDRGKNQLMNKDTYEREQKQKQEQLEQLQTSKRQGAYRKEMTKLMTALKASSVQNHHVITVDGIQFQLREDGSKLFRVADGDTTSNKETPKRTKIAGVEFHRTKNGNLVRAKAVKHLSSSIQQKPRPQCAHFTIHGNCPHGPSCKFTHDPSRVSICKHFLRHGTCPAGKNCDLSHEPTYHRVPACTHFLRGNCTNENCRYPHIHVSPSAPVCKPFATLGYCPDGPKCTKRHVSECADYANTGFCADRENGKCGLPHIDRAATMRKAADRQTMMNVEDEDESDSDGDGNDDPSDPDRDMPDVDSDDADMIIGGGGDDDDDHSMSQQRDFISLS